MLHHTRRNTALYASIITAIGERIKGDVPEWPGFQAVDQLIADFSDAETQGWRQATGLDNIVGCQVWQITREHPVPKGLIVVLQFHFTQSVNRIAQRVGANEYSVAAFKALAKSINFATSAEDVMMLFEVCQCSQVV